ncbi:MAG: hypothetical protein QOE58_152 [Actinomycetota bacterium]|jgi:hypothetical protein|nr:hypothetical protein [Actinomycetota bacterium]
MSKAAVRFCISVAFLLSVSACSGAGTEQVGSQSTPTTAVNGQAPPTENTTAPEQPQPPQEGKPGVSLATLPIGGNDSAGGPCVQVNWSGGDIPEGFGEKVESVSFEPDAYQQSDSGCPGPACIGHTFKASELECDLAIKPADPSATARSDTDQVNVSMQGSVVCPDPGAAQCKTFDDSVRGQTSVVTVALPIPPEGSQGSNGSGETTSPATTESSGG